MYPKGESMSVPQTQISRQTSGDYKNGRSQQRLIWSPPKNLVLLSPFSLEFYLFWQNGPLIFDDNNYFLATSKEYIDLDKTTKQDFWLEIWFDLLPGSANSFATELDKYSKQYGYGFLFNVLTERQVDPSNVINITYIYPIHVLEKWNKINDDLIARKANKVWGTRNWTNLPPNIEKQVAEITNAPGKIGVANTVTCIGQKKFLQQWKLTILSHEIMQLLTPEAQIGIKIHKQKFQCTDPFSNKTIDDGDACLLLNKVLKMMCPEVKTNAYAELAKIRSIKPINHAYSK